MEYSILDKTWSGQIRKLWKEAFDDSESYMDFYYQYVYPDNVVFGAYDKNKLVSMIHLNPYSVMFEGREMTLHYIVGVATDEEYRKQGVMKTLMLKCCEYLKSLGEPFTYLMPENEIYYAGMGFCRYEDSVIVPIKSYEKMMQCHQDNENGKQLNNYEKDICIKSVSDVYEHDLERFNYDLYLRYDLFAVHDSRYMELLDRQCRAENGEAYVLYKSGAIQAVFGFMEDGGCYECVQYISLRPSVEELICIYKILKLNMPEKIEIFGMSPTYKEKLLNFPKGKGIMYKMLDNGIQSDILCDKMLMINEII
ncbi:MAG: GNAT family N-acetyltransferase [Coprococcus sp.]